MSSGVKLVCRTTALGISAFTSGYYDRMLDESNGIMATLGLIFALCVCGFVTMMMIFDSD